MKRVDRAALPLRLSPLKRLPHKAGQSIKTD
jgi:hypothetical protein